MIEKTNMHIAYAYNLQGPLAIADGTTFEEGQFVQYDENGSLEIADGTKRAFPCLTSDRAGRDNVSSQGVKAKIVYLRGAGTIGLTNKETDKVFDSTKTYAPDTALVVGTNGALRPMLASSETSKYIVAYARGPVTGGILTIDFVDNDKV